MKNYIGISRDHSGSMAGLTRTAVKDYNANIDSIKEGAATHSIDTVVSVIKCGVNPTSSAKFAYYGTRSGGNSINEFEVVNSSVNSLKHLTTYEANGHIHSAFTRKSKSRIARAIRKYGRDGFEKLAIFYADSQQELDKLEELTIKAFKATEKRIGYNILLGASFKVPKQFRGSGMLGKKRSKESIEKTASKIRGRKKPDGAYTFEMGNTFSKFKKSEEHKEKISQSMKKFWKEKNKG